MNKSLVLVTGCFDIVTKAHVMLLMEASKLGKLIVGLNDDASVRALKGDMRPINTFSDREYVLTAFHFVDHVVPIHGLTVEKVIREVKPGYWVKGGDWKLSTLNQEEVRAANEIGAEILIMPHMAGYSTTETLRKLAL